MPDLSATQRDALESAILADFSVAEFEQVVRTVAGPACAQEIGACLEVLARSGQLGNVIGALVRFREAPNVSAAARDLVQLQRSDQPGLQPTRGYWALLELETVRALSPAVCRIDVLLAEQNQSGPKTWRGMGTGFLIGPDLVVTCYHVLMELFPRHANDNNRGPNVTPAEVRALFDYTNEGAIHDGQCYPLAEQWNVCHSHTTEHDYAVLRLARPAGYDLVTTGADRVRGWLRPTDSDDGHQQLVILQHPKQQPLQFAFGTVTEPPSVIPDGQFCYRVDADYGTSGAPCLQKDGAVVGIHRGEFPNKDPDQLVRLGVDYRRVLRHATTLPTIPPLPALTPRRLNLGRLPTPTHPNPIRRDQYVRGLDELWQKSRQGLVQIVQIVADGGMGKSTVVWRWLDDLRLRNYPQITRALDWSFSFQGADEQVVNSADFLTEAARPYKLDPTVMRLPQLGRAVGEAFVNDPNGGLIVLDGVEPLQYHPNRRRGTIEDEGLREFLRVVRADGQRPAPTPPRMLVLTTRWRVPELSELETIQLPALTMEEGAELLREFRLAGAIGLPDRLHEG